MKNNNKIDKPSIAVDESGNTGQDLFSIEQPTFTLASVLLSEENTITLVNMLEGAQQSEIHFARLKRRSSGRQKIVKLLQSDLITPDNAIVDVYHKRFMIVAKAVDLLIEPMLYDAKIDLFEDSENIVISNAYYYFIPAFCTDALFNNFLQRFVQMVRNKEPKDIIGFYEATLELLNSCSEPEFKPMIKLFHDSQNIINREIIKWDITYLDPAYSSFFNHCGYWTARLDTKFDLIVDESKPLRYFEKYLYFYRK